LPMPAWAGSTDQVSVVAQLIRSVALHGVGWGLPSASDNILDAN
jgi:hypothetical protein